MAKLIFQAKRKIKVYLDGNFCNRPLECQVEIREIEGPHRFRITALEGSFLGRTEGTLLYDDVKELLELWITGRTVCTFVD